jgi:cobalt/nickel transport system ATP-binding protein
MTQAIVVENLSFTYPDGQPALRGVNFEVEEGEALGIIGPNGAGKSTLLLHLNGLLQAETGTVKIFDQAVGNSNLKWVRRQVGLVFQDPDDQLFSPTVFDDVAFGPLNLGMPKHEIGATVSRVLNRMGISGYSNRSPHHLSLGEKRRVAIACVLAMSPSILVLDEPTSNLDPGGKWQLTALLKELPGTRIIVSHDLELVRDVCHRLLILDGCSVITQGATEDILADKQLLAAHRLVAPVPGLVV